MKKAQIEKQRRMCQRNLKRVIRQNLIYHIAICLFIMIVALYGTIGKCIESPEDIVESQHETKTTRLQHVPTIQVDTQEDEVKAKVVVPMCPKFTHSKDWDYEDSYLLAKIAMTEAEGCNIHTKTLVIMTVLNRVWSDEFPDTIEEVIFQENQFSPIDNGRWDRVEPNEDCYEAVKIVMEAKYDYSGGATYFENCADEDNWHSRNLEYLYESEGIRFYK